jgi:hypothetical protein
MPDKLFLGFEVSLPKDGISWRQRNTLGGAIGRMMRFPFVPSLARPAHECFYGFQPACGSSLSAFFAKLKS